MPKGHGGEARSDLRQALGRRMRGLREEVEMTLEEAGSRCGLAPSTIHKIEAGRVSPSYESLVRIAYGYDVGIERLFGAGTETQPPTTRMTVTRSGQGQPVEGRVYDYEMLCTALAHKRIVPMLAKIPPRDALGPDDFCAHDGEETIFVLSGRIELQVEHYAPAILEPGDCSYFDSGLQHAIRALDNVAARIFWAATHVDLRTGHNTPKVSPNRSP